MKRRRVLAAALAGSSTALAGCANAFPSRSTARPRPATVPTTADRGDAAFTYGPPSGNRLAPGRADLGATARVDVELARTPAWVVGAPTPATDSDSGDGVEAGGTTWVVAHEDGTLEAVTVADGDAGVGPVSPPSLPVGTPPAFVPSTNEVLVPPRGASTLTHPTPTAAGVAVVRDDGALAVGDRTHAVDALPDGRVVVGDDHAVVLAGATRQYDHGALGDGVEAGAVAVVSLPEGDVSTFPVDGGVVEGTSPMLADVTGDGTRDVLVTESDATDGARLAAYDATGTVLARGPPVGSGYRWRHQLAVAAFAPDGTREVAVVKTPHIGGTVEFYQRDGDRFRIAATADGYSSHALGSRNLDGARAMDTDDDGRVELVVPTDDRRALAVLARTRGGVDRVDSLALPAPVAGNLATATVDGTTALGVITRRGLHVWPT
jgi:hypothetical protein